MLLEECLDAKLFERIKRGAGPSENGRVVIEQVRRIVTDINNLKTTARNVSYGVHGRNAVGYCSSLMSGSLKHIFTEYLNRRQDVQFDGTEAGPEKLLHGLQAHTVDAAIVPIGLQETGIKSRRLWSERLMVVMLRGNRLIQQERIYWPNLRREVFVVPNSNRNQTVTSPVG